MGALIDFNFNSSRSTFAPAGASVCVSPNAKNGKTTVTATLVARSRRKTYNVRFRAARNNGNRTPANSIPNVRQTPFGLHQHYVATREKSRLRGTLRSLPLRFPSKNVLHRSSGKSGTLSKKNARPEGLAYQFFLVRTREIIRRLERSWRRRRRQRDIELRHWSR